MQYTRFLIHNNYSISASCLEKKKQGYREKVPSKNGLLLKIIHSSNQLLNITQKKNNKQNPRLVEREIRKIRTEIK